MDRSAIAMSLIFIGGLMVAGSLGGQDALATEKKEAYVPPGAVKKGPIKGAFAWGEGADCDRRSVHHACRLGRRQALPLPVLFRCTCLRARSRSMSKVKERRTFKAGELYRNRLGHRCRRGTKCIQIALKLLVFQVTRAEGEPLMVKDRIDLRNGPGESDQPGP